MAWRMKNLIIKRYEIYFADLNPSIGSEIKKIRPVVVISQDEMNRYLETVVICPLTSKLHTKWRSRLEVTCGNKKAEIAVFINTITQYMMSIIVSQAKKKITGSSLEFMMFSLNLFRIVYGKTMALIYPIVFTNSNGNEVNICNS